MPLIFTLFQEAPFFIFPDGLGGWLGLAAWLGIIGYLIYHWRDYGKKWGANHWIAFVALLIITPMVCTFVGVRLPPSDTISLPSVTLDPSGLPLMLFSALPWVLAAGFLGPLSAGILAFVAGLFIGLWGTHTLFTALELATLAILLSAASQQRYRTTWFRALRHPLFATLSALLVHPFLFVISSILLVDGSIAGKLDYAVTLVGSTTLAVGGPVLVAGLLVEFIRFAFPKAWGGQPPWAPSPAESSLEARFSYFLTLALILLFVGFAIGDWVVAGNAAEKMLEDRMAAATEVASAGVPYFLDTGQNLILQIASNVDIVADSSFQLQEVLSESYQSVPFFKQLYILDPLDNQIAAYPTGTFKDILSSLEEQVGMDMALEGVPVQVYAIPSLDGSNSTQISFLAAITDDAEQAVGVLIGRTDLISNPYTQSTLTNLNSVSDIGGVGLLVDEDGDILYHSESEWIFPEYSASIGSEAVFYDGSAPDGTRLLVYSRPTVGRSWGTVLMVPARQAQQLALNIAAPLLVMIFLLIGVSAVMMRLSLSVITSSIKSLTGEAERISQGQLDHALSKGGVDEAGRLRNAFEKMRLSLKARLDELNRLLIVSQAVAFNLEITEALQPIIESALTTGASSARIALPPDVVPENDAIGAIPSRYGVGNDADNFAYFDDQLLALMKDQEKGRVVLANPARTPLLSFGPGAPRLGSLVAVALYHERTYYGVLWAAYDQPHSFTDEEVQFITTLGSQAALATANARLFMTAEFERERLAAILASTPDPVLVTDQRDCLLLVNAEAWGALGLGIETSIGKPVDEVISQIELVDLLRLSDEAPELVEVKLPGERFFMATASTITVDGQNIGRVCVLKDVTQFKELDALKSEFVATVSHDLRSPLTLMRGYATMLEMVGELNEQQSEYVRKIVVGVESISRLVNNLLDLGRIEAGVGLQLEMLPVRDVVEWVVESFQLQAQQKKITLSADVPANMPPLIEADPALLQQALHNLVENAVKYTPEGGKVWVRVKPRQSTMLFVVEDTGIGISPVDQPYLFEKFYRGTDRKAKKERGTGLGLAIVKSIIERHGGNMGLDSQLGEGSTFYIEIPLRHEAQ
ncbi:MAG: GAF domain-containing protein [Anaerolineales bacterium]|nr:GAF domain-containing protein [Anaerolineales bacterium]